MIDLLAPPTVAQAARRLSTILITMAVLVFFLFPVSATAGTEVPLDRYVTGGLLAGFGLALRFRSVNCFLLLVVHAASQLAFGAPWAAILSGGGLVYAGGALLRMRRGGITREPKEEQDLHPADIVRENVESIAMALLIALACREFLYEAFLIPTASMEPTILGQDERVGRTHGDRLLATKIPMLAGDPPRWSIVVFKYPLFRRVNYIKRLVGLPGEHMELRHGDIYINEKCVAKPEAIQNQLWFAEYPLPGPARPLGQALTRDDQNAEWTLLADSVAADVPTGVESRLFYDETLDRTETDLQIGADVELSRLDADGAVLLRVEGASRRVSLSIGAQSARLDAPGLDGHVIEGLTLLSGPCRVSLGVADRVIRVWIDGHLVARVPHADDVNDGETMPRASIGLTGAAATFTAVRVYRDLQYTKSRDWNIPDDGFVMLGDNTLSSKDSREWRVNVLTTADGRVYEGEEDVKLEDNSIVRFRTSDDGFYEFIDIDGIFRRVPVEGTTVESGVHRPFVRRPDLVGRAFVTFFPFPPFGNSRLHFLP